MAQPRLLRLRGRWEQLEVCHRDLLELGRKRVLDHGARQHQRADPEGAVDVQASEPVFAFMPMLSSLLA